VTAILWALIGVFRVLAVADVINSVAFDMDLGAKDYEEQEDGTVQLAPQPLLQVLSHPLRFHSTFLLHPRLQPALILSFLVNIHVSAVLQPILQQCYQPESLIDW